MWLLPQCERRHAGQDGMHATKGTETMNCPFEMQFDVENIH